MMSYAQRLAEARTGRTEHPSVAREKLARTEARIARALALVREREAAQERLRLREMIAAAVVVSRERMAAQEARQIAAWGVKAAERDAKLGAKRALKAERETKLDAKRALKVERKASTPARIRAYNREWKRAHRAAMKAAA